MLHKTDLLIKMIKHQNQVSHLSKPGQYWLNKTKKSINTRSNKE